ncbi:hypothetical protein J3459_009895 [Metarhizium acridum]|nr:hypothetical protein J3459_009895 [Metarhizium acridum]
MTASSLILAHNGGVDKTKLKILACASPFTGHTMPIINIVEVLIQRGYDVTFIAGDEYRERIERSGAKFFSVPPIILVQPVEESNRHGLYFARIRQSLLKYFIEPTKAQKDVLYNVLEHMKREAPTHNIVILTETFYLGDAPMYLGAALPHGFTRRPRTVNIHAVPYTLPSQDTPPFCLGLIPDGRDESLETYRAQYKEMVTVTFADSIATHEKTLRDLGAVNYEAALPIDTLATAADVTLQMCPPSLEYKRSDIHPKVRFAGALNYRPSTKMFVSPSFWEDVTRGDRIVIVVSQGTIAVDYADLLIPSLQALKHRSDIFVVAILGRRGASLSAEVQIPPNARVIDYLPYDAVLPRASVFIMNAGYGGFIQGVLNGVPMILAGDSEDKPEVAARGEYAGVAVNLKTATPSEEQIRGAVSTVLGNSNYKKRVLEVKQENEEMKAMDTVERAIFEMAAVS